MATRPKPFFTPEQYLAFEREAEAKHEYLDGQIFDMAGASREHNTISSNLHGLLWSSLRRNPCRPFTSDMKVLAGPFGSYPDITVVCGEQRFQDEQRDALTNPTLVIEVLSDSTEAYDRGEKFLRYQQIESLREYVLVSQDRPRIERFLRQEDGSWNYLLIEGADAAVRLEAIGVTLSLAEVYEGVAFEETPG
jgi:Uma2 family endonuclease